MLKPRLETMGYNLHSKKAAQKLTHVLPSQLIPCRLTVPGMLLVANSSRRRRVPFLERKPTMILGTPNKKDWIQNFNSFRSNLTLSWSDWISSEVLSSTQFISWSLSSGFRSQTLYISNVNKVSEVYVMKKGPVYLPASTSPPRITEVLPMPVWTTEQYCAMLSTIWVSRLSIWSLEVSSQIEGMSARDSNLYPINMSAVVSESYRDCRPQ